MTRAVGTGIARRVMGQEGFAFRIESISGLRAADRSRSAYIDTCTRRLPRRSLAT